MPHWINLSFYNKPKRLSSRHPTFIPRVKLPPEVEQVIPENISLLTDKYFPRGSPLPAPGTDNITFLRPVGRTKVHSAFGSFLHFTVITNNW
jgi:hypothetical protein